MTMWIDLTDYELASIERRLRLAELALVHTLARPDGRQARGTQGRLSATLARFGRRRAGSHWGARAKRHSLASVQ